MRRKRSPLTKTVLGALAGGFALKKAVDYLRREDLNDKVVVITGGSRGLGYLLGREFAKAGCKVAICARNQNELDQAAEELKKISPHIFHDTCDVSDQDRVGEFISEVKNRWGSIDVLVNNAGIIKVEPLENTREADFREALDVIFWGVFNPTIATVPLMQERGGGHIVNISSIGGVAAVPHMLPYTCAKYAVTGFSQGLHAELKKDNISVTTVIPSTMRTGSYQQAEFGGDRQHEFAWFALGATLPGLSVSAERAAKNIVRAVRERRPTLTIGLPAKILRIVNGVLPNTTARIAEMTNRLMPGPAAGGAGTLKGQSIPPPGASWFQRLTVLGRKAFEKYQKPGSQREAS